MEKAVNHGWTTLERPCPTSGSQRTDGGTTGAVIQRSEDSLLTASRCGRLAAASKWGSEGWVNDKVEEGGTIGKDGWGGDKVGRTSDGCSVALRQRVSRLHRLIRFHRTTGQDPRVSGCGIYCSTLRFFSYSIMQNVFGINTGHTIYFGSCGSAVCRDNWVWRIKSSC